MNVLRKNALPDDVFRPASAERVGDAAGMAWQALDSFLPSNVALNEGGLLVGDMVPSGSAARDEISFLRTRVLQALREKGWRRLGVTSPGRGNGASFLAGNLALSLGRLHDKRTVLLDFDLTAPSIARNFALLGTPGLTAMLGGQKAPAETILRVGNALGIAANAQPCQTAAEHFLSDSCTAALSRIEAEFAPDVLLFDLPPLSERDNFHAAVAHVDCVLLVVEAGQTRPREARRAEEEINSRCPLLGIVLNKSS